VLVLLAVLVVRLAVAGGVFYAPEQVRFGEVVGAEGAWEAVALFVGVVFSLNLVLAALNLLPFPPLDGSGAVPLLLNAAATERYQRFLWGNPALGWIGILVAWQVFAAVFQPVFLVAVNVLYPGVSYR
jgi:Zn-dependent protease